MVLLGISTLVGAGAAVLVQVLRQMAQVSVFLVQVSREMAQVRFRVGDLRQWRA